MERIEAGQCIQLALERFPGFQERWDKHTEFWGDEDAGVGNDMAAFSDYVADLINAEDCALLPEIFQFVEELLEFGDQDTATVVTTCFLENLLNREVTPRLFIPLLGSKSRAYCRAWNDFTGTTTEGL